MSDARIFEGGYRRYEGVRLGAAHATRAVWWHTLRRILGLGRPARSKVLPVLSILMAYVPMVVFVGLVAFLPRGFEGALPEYAFTYGFITASILLFVIFVAPEALCPDRRSGVLSLYLATPLTRTRYLLAKAAAVGTALLFVTLGPPLLYLIGLALQGAGPDGVAGFLSVLGKIVVAGILLSAFYTAMSVGVASCTDRRAIAGAATFFVPQVSAVAVGIMVEAFELPAWLLAFGMNLTGFGLAITLFGEEVLAGDADSVVVPMAALVTALVFWTTAGAALAWWRYQRLQVTR